MLAVLELIGLYSDVNQEIIDKQMHAISAFYRRVTADLQDIRTKLIDLPLVSPNTSAVQANPRYESIWNFYRKDLIDDNIQPD
jgi:hypothetical protein